MPVPEKGEKQKDFIERCIPIVIADGTAKDGAQANAICHSIWDESKQEKGAMMYVKLEERETRCLPSAELRIAGDAKAPKIAGYAAVFNTWADIGGWFRESIRPGAFAKSIKENDIRALLNHDENYVLGRNKAGTLRLHEDAKGLSVEIDPVPAGWANDLMASMKRGDVNQMSFGFQVNKQEMDYGKNERVLVDVTLFDVSVVTFPAYPTTSAQVRSAFKAESRAMDMSDMEAVMAKMKKGEPMTEDDMKVMQKYMDKMKAMMKDGGMKSADTEAEYTSVSVIGTVIPKEWEDFYGLINKMKQKEPLTDDEIRRWAGYVPLLSVPPAQHTETPPEPAANHSEGDTRIKGPRWMELSLELDNYYARK